VSDQKKMTLWRRDKPSDGRMHWIAFFPSQPFYLPTHHSMVFSFSSQNLSIRPPPKAHNGIPLDGCNSALPRSLVWRKKTTRPPSHLLLYCIGHRATNDDLAISLPNKVRFLEYYKTAASYWVLLDQGSTTQWRRQWMDLIHRSPSSCDQDDRGLPRNACPMAQMHGFWHG